MYVAPVLLIFSMYLNNEKDMKIMKKLRNMNKIVKVLYKVFEFFEFIQTKFNFCNFLLFNIFTIFFFQISCYCSKFSVCVSIQLTTLFNSPKSLLA